MTKLPPYIMAYTATWPTQAQAHFADLRHLVHEVAAAIDVGPLDESLKWGQPAWRPRRARTGSTLRVDWSPATPDRLLAFVDCKTDIAAQMDLRFPGQFGNDGRRAMGFDLEGALPRDALWQLAHMTLAYHRNKRASA